jgi:hypothetical protein
VTGQVDSSTLKAHRLAGLVAYLERGFFNGERAGDFGGTASVYNAIVLDKITHDAESIVDRAFGLVNQLNVFT